MGRQSRSNRSVVAQALAVGGEAKEAGKLGHGHLGELRRQRRLKVAKRTFLPVPSPSAARRQRCATRVTYHRPRVRPSSPANRACLERQSVRADADARCSTVSLTTRRRTKTSRSWPRRWTLVGQLCVRDADAPVPGLVLDGRLTGQIGRDRADAPTRPGRGPRCGCRASGSGRLPSQRRAAKVDAPPPHFSDMSITGRSARAATI